MENRKNTANLEDVITKMTARNAAMVPSKMFLCAAIAGVSAAIALKCMGHKHTSLLLGQWSGTFLLLGIYNKIVKTHHNNS